MDGSSFFPLPSPFLGVSGIFDPAAFWVAPKKWGESLWFKFNLHLWGDFMILHIYIFAEEGENQPNWYLLGMRFDRLTTLRFVQFEGALSVH